MERIKKGARILFYSVSTFSLFAVLTASEAMAQVQQRWYVPKVFTRWDSLPQVVFSIIQIAFMAAGLVAVIYLIIGGFRYVTSGGNPDTVELAKATILNAIIGLIVVLISFLLVNFILTQTGVMNRYIQQESEQPF